MTAASMTKAMSLAGVEANKFILAPQISHIVLVGNSNSYAKETTDYYVLYKFDTTNFILYEAKYYKALKKAYLTRIIDMSKIESIVMLTPFSEGQLTSAA